MNLSKYICPNCRRSELRIQSTVWKCEHCGSEYTTVNGIPRLYVESELGKKDKELRDKFYNGFLGTYYQYVMPFLSLPARPARMSWKEWLFYALPAVACRIPDKLNPRPRVWFDRADRRRANHHRDRFLFL